MKALCSLGPLPRRTLASWAWHHRVLCLWRLSRALRVCLLALLCAAGSTAFAAGDGPRMQTHYRLEALGSPLVDPLSAVEAARRADDWKPYAGVLSLGYGEQAYWLRLTLSPQGSDSPRVLRMRPSFLDDVQVFVPGADGSMRVHVLGDRQGQGELYDGALTLDLAALDKPAAQELYVRIQTTSARMAGVWVQSQADAERSRTVENLGMGVYFGVMLCLLAWSLAQAVLERDMVFGWYAVYQGASTMMNFGLLGYARLFLPEGWSADAWSTAFVLSISVFAPLFHLALVRSVMAPAAVPIQVRLVLWVAFGAAAVNLLQILLGRVGSALAVNASLVTLLALTLSGLVVLLAVRQPQSPLRKLLWGYTLLCTFTLWTMLPLIGLVQGGAWTLFSTSIHGVLLALLLGAMLLVRGSELKAQALRSRQLVVEEQARTRQAQGERDEKDRFLAMLTHELRTPLSVIRMVLDGARRRETMPAVQRQLDLARTSVTDIDQVIERTLLVDRMERRSLDSKRVACDLAEMVGLCLASIGPPLNQCVDLVAPAQGVHAEADPMLLRLVLMNLLDNAIKYGHPDARVSVVVRAGDGEPDGVPRIRVNNLPGRAGRPDGSRVFSKYYRSDGAKHSTGSGLGLYLVQGLVGDLGWGLRCDPGRADDPDSPVCFELRCGRV